jgi:hypothetical protein
MSKEAIKRKKCYDMSQHQLQRLYRVNGELEKVWVEDIDRYFRTMSVHLMRESRETHLT